MAGDTVVTEKPKILTEPERVLIKTTNILRDKSKSLCKEALVNSFFNSVFRPLLTAGAEKKYKEEVLSIIKRFYDQTELEEEFGQLEEIDFKLLHQYLQRQDEKLVRAIRAYYKTSDLSKHFIGMRLNRFPLENDVRLKLKQLYNLMLEQDKLLVSQFLDAPLSQDYQAFFSQGKHDDVIALKHRFREAEPSYPLTVELRKKLEEMTGSQKRLDREVFPEPEYDCYSDTILAR